MLLTNLEVARKTKTFYKAQLRSISGREQFISSGDLKRLERDINYRAENHGDVLVEVTKVEREIVKLIEH